MNALNLKVDPLFKDRLLHYKPLLPEAGKANQFYIDICSQAEPEKWAREKPHETCNPGWCKFRRPPSYWTEEKREKVKTRIDMLIKMYYP